MCMFKCGVVARACFEPPREGRSYFQIKAENIASEKWQIYNIYIQDQSSVS